MVEASIDVVTRRSAAYGDGNEAGPGGGDVTWT
jgi:hypothetical protein